MKKKARCVNMFVVFVLFLLFLNPAHADDAEPGVEDAGLGLAVGAKISTLGAGVEVTKQVVSSLNLRLGINGAEYDYDGTESGIEYDFDLKLFSGTVLVDWHPWSGGFRVTGGAMINGNGVDFEAKPASATSTFTIGNNTYNAANVGTLSGEIDFNTLVPYVGIGWGNAVDENKHWGFTFDLGVVYQGSPDVKYSANGTLASNAAFQADLERERVDLESELDSFEYYPIIAVGVTYKF